MTETNSQNAQTEQGTSSTPAWFWVVAVTALLWNLIGLAAFLIQLNMTPEMLAQLSPEEQQLYQNFPPLLYWFFGAAVGGGVLGCILLLIKRQLAWWLFLISLVGVVVQNGVAFLQLPILEVQGAAALVMPCLVFIIGLGLLIFTKKMTARGILH